MYHTVSRGITARAIPQGWLFIFYALALLVALALAAPSVQAAPGPFVKVSGKVTNSYTGAGVPGATVKLTATGTTITMVTDASGNYANNKVQVGSYSMSTSATNYTGATQPLSLLKGNATVNVALVPVARVIVTASVSGTAAPGASLTGHGSCTIMDGSNPLSSGWSQGAEGVPATIGGGNNPTISLKNATTYAAHLIAVLQSPPISEADLPPDLKLQPINEIEKGLQDRNQVVAINPKAEEEGSALPLVFTCKTSSGTYTKAVSVTVGLPWVINPGVKTVPVNVPVLVLAKCGQSIVNGAWTPCTQTSFTWTIDSKPGGSTATLTDATSRNPWFTPDKTGTYVVKEANSNLCTAPASMVGTSCSANADCDVPANSGNGSGVCDADVVLDIHAGRYHGAIDPILTLESVQTGDGRPVGDESCTTCHYEGGAAPANFDLWRNTGHAEAFYLNMAASNHFGESCFGCHTVGFDRDTAGGIDNVPNYQSMLNLMANVYALPPEGVAPSLYPNIWPTAQPDDPNQPTMLEDYPDTARLSNVQCENCHGPQDYTNAHKNQPGAPRVSLAAEVCGSCHGEPARHGRFQQWQLSSHADYDLARDRGAPSGTTAGNTNNCGRCHSGNGFIQWSAHDFDPAYLLNVTWNKDTVVPQVCAACHNPHDTGTTSGGPDTNAKVRLMGDTNILLAGFMADNVGKAATCMSCHNSRGGFQFPASTGPWFGRNDATWGSQTTAQKTGTPHHGVQADLLMGQNAYFFTPSELVRGKHSLIEDVCITCHMEKTAPPDILSYNKSGTNHTFAADPNVCSQCHGGGVTAANINNIVVGYMGDLATALGGAYKRMMVQHYPVTSGAASGASDASCPGTGTVSANGTTTTITNVAWVYSNRLQVTTSDGICRNVAISGITIGGATPNLQNFSLLAGNDSVWKATWNYGLLAEDSAGRTDHPGARGVHNPDFSIKMLTRAITAVQAVAVP